MSPPQLAGFKKGLRLDVVEHGTLTGEELATREALAVIRERVGQDDPRRVVNGRTQPPLVTADRSQSDPKVTTPSRSH